MQPAGAAIDLGMGLGLMSFLSVRLLAPVEGGKRQERLASYSRDLNDWLADVKQAASPVKLWARAEDETAQPAHD